MRKPLDLPVMIAKAFAEDTRAYFAEPNAIKRDEIAARQLHALREFQGPREKKLRLHDIRPADAAARKAALEAKLLAAGKKPQKNPP